MKRSEFEKLLERTFDTVTGINGSKGKEYASDEEALANFYNRADEYGTDPLVVCGIFLGKHLDAIKAYIKTGEVLSEDIDGRIHDAILYLVLLLGLIEDGRADEQSIVEHAGENQLSLLDEAVDRVPVVLPRVSADGEYMGPGKVIGTDTRPGQAPDFQPAEPEFTEPPDMAAASRVAGLFRPRTQDEVHGDPERLPVETAAHRATQSVVDTQTMHVVDTKEGAA